MGTNFYKMDGTHIGKRSAAGRYCWDCDVTLCKDGVSAIHFGKSDWYTRCPSCGRSPEDNGANATFKELGFSAVKGKQTGVSSCCSFTWAIEPNMFMQSKFRRVKDEYDRVYTRDEFIEELEFCPVRYYDSIGQGFS